MRAERVIELLGLEPLPHEGGAFRETYRSSARISEGGLRSPADDQADARGERACSTQIYYLLRGDQTSSLHRVRSDEVFHHYLGDAVEQLWIDDGSRTGEVVSFEGPGSSELKLIGSGLELGERPQVVVPAHVWQGARLKPGGDHGFALLGCTVSPGFEWEDFELVSEEQAGAMIAAFPEHAALISELTPVEGRTRA